jgi:hypothetical protein
MREDIAPPDTTPENNQAAALVRYEGLSYVEPFDKNGCTSNWLPLWLRLRNWLIVKLAGKSVVVLNADIDTVPMAKNLVIELHGKNGLVGGIAIRSQHNGRVLRIRPSHQPAGEPR